MKKVNFSSNLKALRIRRGLNQEKLGEKCCVSRQAVAKWESGESQPDIEKITDLTSILDVTLDELFYDTIDNQTDDIDLVNKKIDDLTRLNITGMSKIEGLIQHLFEQKEGKPINNLYESYIQMQDDNDEREKGFIMLEEGKEALNDFNTDKAFELFEQAILRGVTGSGFELIKLFTDWYESTIEMESEEEIISLEVFCGKYIQLCGRIMMEENIRKYGFDETVFK